MACCRSALSCFVFGCCDQLHNLNSPISSPLHPTPPYCPPLGSFPKLATQEMEAGAGRDLQGGARWGPRPLDLDLVAYGAGGYSDPHLQVPHPRYGSG